MLHSKVHLRFYFKKRKKNSKKCEEKDAFNVSVDVSFDDAIKVTSLNLKFGSLRVLCILYSTTQAKLMKIFKLGFINKAPMWVKESGRGVAKTVINCFSDPNFFLKVHTRETRNEKKLDYFSVRTLWMKP